jgi:WD40 repeat protein
MHLGTKGIGFSPDGERIITWSGSGGIQLWDTYTGQPLIEPEAPDGKQGIEAAAYSPDGIRLAASTLSFNRRGEVTIWSARSHEPTQTYQSTFNLGNYNGRVSFSPDGRFIAAWRSNIDKRDRGGALVVWEVSSKRRVFEREFFEEGLRSVEFSLDSSTLRTVSAIGTSQPIDVVTGVSTRIQSVEWAKPSRTSPDGRYYAIIQERSIQIVDCDTPSVPLVERTLATAPQQHWHELHLRKWEKTTYHFSAWAHLEAIAALSPNKRLELIKKRTTLLTPALFGPPIHPFGWTLLARPEVYNFDPANSHRFNLALTQLNNISPASRRAIDIRTLGGLLLRSGKPEDALVLLKQAASVRDEDVEPPVSELLLAIAYKKMGMESSGLSFFRNAVSWMDMYTSTKKTRNELRESYDPRYRLIDWESWHEAEIFRKEAERLYTP